MTVELPLLTPDIIGALDIYLHLFVAGSNAQLDQTSVFLLCTTLVDNAIPRDAGDRKDPSPSISCMGVVQIMHASVQKTEKKLSQFQAPSYSLFYLSLGVILTLLIFLACCSSLRFLALWVVTAAPYVTHAVTSLPLLTHASLSFAAKKNKIHRAFICCLN